MSASPVVVARYLTVGGLCGLTWAASLRGWMVQVAQGDRARD